MKNKYKIVGDYVEIFMTRRNGETFTTQVSKKHLEKLLEFDVKWHPDWKPKIKNYYAQATIYIGMVEGKAKYKTLYLHRFIMNAKENEMVDHVGITNTLDNRDKNLRIVNNKDNSKHRNGINSNNTSGYRNVAKIGKWWRVQLQVNGKNKLFSEKFEDVNDAGKFAEKMREKYYRDYKGK